MTDILKNVLNIAARIHDMQAAGTLAMAFFGIVLVFGLVNCILGYRLLRFWMMIFGFLMGAGAGFFGVYEAGASDKTIYVVVMLIAGEDSIREINPFPMNKNAQDVMMGAPAEVDEKQLREVHIKISAPEKQ